MILRRLELEGFRNYGRLSLEFNRRKVILLGENAQGKTNLLEAVAVLATGQSPFTTRDTDLVGWGAEQAIVRSELEGDLGPLSVDLLFRANGRRAIRVNGLYQKRVADLRGKVPVVVFSSRDLGLVKGGPGERREFLDAVLASRSRPLHELSVRYGKVLAQRNAVLRAETVDPGQLAIWDAQLIKVGTPLMQHRQRLVARLDALASRWHDHVSGGRERVALAYQPAVEPPASEGEPDPAAWAESWMRKLQEGRAAELGRRQSLWGPHRDDVALRVDGQDARAFASAGQQRTIVLALKLAELELAGEGGEVPILLLDDVLAELDIRRQNALLEAIGPNTQTFVTSTHLSDFAAHWIDEAEIHLVRGGEVRPFGGSGS